MTQQPFSTALDASRSGIIGYSMINQTTHNLSRNTKMMDSEANQSRRHVERLLLRLDFNGGLSKPRQGRGAKDTDILAEGGLA